LLTLSPALLGPSIPAMVVEGIRGEGDSEFKTGTELLALSLRIPSRQLTNSWARFLRRTMMPMRITAIANQKTQRWPDRVF
jgi:hypothetical protein